MNTKAIRLRLLAAAVKAARLGETAHPYVLERAGGTATFGVIFKRGHTAALDLNTHGSAFDESERAKLERDVLKMLAHRSEQTASK